jgi:hypothetical protein
MSFEAVEGDAAQRALAQSGKLTSAEFRIISGKNERDEWLTKCVFVNEEYRLTFELFGVEGKFFPH